MFTTIGTAYFFSHDDGLLNAALIDITVSGQVPIKRAGQTRQEKIIYGKTRGLSTLIFYVCGISANYMLVLFVQFKLLP